MSYNSLSPSMGIVDFWFSAEVQPFWFVKDRNFDETLRQRFEGAYNEAVSRFQNGKVDDLRNGKEALACVIILDQLSRNMFRDTPKAFATDDLALKISNEAVRKGFEKELPSVAHHNFLYMPFMHSESLEDQEEGIRLFSLIPGNEQTIAYACQHRDIIARFGRFPHRNKTLDRTSTPEEIDFLKEFQGF